MSGSPSRSGYALVTGGAVRLGAYIARRLAADGWNIAIHYREHDTDAKALAAELAKTGVKSTVVGADLADADALPGVFARAAAELGFCSVLVNSASAFEYDEAGTVSAQSMDPLYEVNFVRRFCSRAILPSSFRKARRASSSMSSTRRSSTSIPTSSPTR
jgi:NAD(P)-dependent dehydrogenase (short-subunit alcohol dehydrogenase family)